MGNIERIQMPKTNGHQPLYSDGVRFGNTLWISGMLPTNAEGNIVGKGNVAAQTEQALLNMKAILETAGLGFEDVVKITIFLVDINHRSEIGAVRRKYFGDKLPASTLVEISRLANPDALIEIEAMAYIGD